MSDIVKYGGLAKLSDEDMRRRNEDNAKVVEACADQAQEWATFPAIVHIGAAPTAGTFTWTVGTGKSDPIPYNADAAQVNAAFWQAAERNRKTPLVNFYGRMAGNQTPTTHPEIAAQAKLRHDTTCASCGQGFKAGDEIVITLAAPPAEGTFRHRQCHPNSQSYAEPQ